MTWITFGHDQAHEALNQFLSGDEDGRDRTTGRRITRNIAKADDSGLAAVIIDPATHGELVDAQVALEEWLHPRADDDPDGYRPFRHCPTASEDRLLPQEPLHDPLAQVFFGKPYADLEEKQQHKVTYAAIVCLLELRLDPDDSGAVPIVMRAHNGTSRDRARPQMLWQLAEKTDVHGLYLRVTANGIFGEEWGIVTGSGFKVTSGYYDRDSCAAAVSAMGRVLPQVNWMTVQDASVFTPAALAALKQVFSRYRQYGVEESQPEPEPVEPPEPALTPGPDPTPDSPSEEITSA